MVMTEPVLYKGLGVPSLIDEIAGNKVFQIPDLSFSPTPQDINFPLMSSMQYSLPAHMFMALARALL